MEINAKRIHGIHDALPATKEYITFVYSCVISFKKVESKAVLVTGRKGP
jgi:hypothetical protein